MPTIDLTCQDCQASFYWKDEDQIWYASQNFSQPKRCFKCRQARKAEKEARMAGASSAPPLEQERGNRRGGR